MSSASFFSAHTYSERVSNRALQDEIDARIASTRWHWALPLDRIEAVRLRLARLHLTGSKRQRSLVALAWGLAVALFTLPFSSTGSGLGGTRARLWHDLYFTLFMGLWWSLIGHLAMRSTGEAACFAIAREIETRRT